MPEPTSLTTSELLSELLATPLPKEAIRDRVIRAAVSNGLVRAADIGRYWRAFTAETNTDRSVRFWRFVADRHGPDQERFYALAAHTYGFDEVEISVSDLIRFLQEIQSTFSNRQWARLKELRMLPIGRVHNELDAREEGALRLIFAASDPTTLEVNNYLSALPVKSFVLKYASARSVDYVLDKVVPVVFSHLSSRVHIRKDVRRVVPLHPPSQTSVPAPPDLKRAA